MQACLLPYEDSYIITAVWPDQDVVRYNVSESPSIKMIKKKKMDPILIRLIGVWCQLIAYYEIIKNNRNSNCF